MRSRPGVLAAVLVALTMLGASLLGPASASAAGVVNGDFETGTLAGWQTHYQSGEGEWFAADAKAAEEQGLASPPSGSFAAISAFEDPDTAILYQDIVLPPASTSQLSMYLYYASGEPIRVPSPNTLVLATTTGIPTTAEENQQVRVDVMKPTAPITSLSPSDILATVFASKNGDPEELAPTLLSANLTPFAGQTVRLRIASVARDFFMDTGVDAVSIASAPISPPAPPVPPSPTPPSNKIVKGKLTLNRKNGTATLAITVPGAGTLTEMDASTKIAIASLTSKGTARKPALIKTSTLHPAAAGTVRVPIRPTAAGRRALGEKGKLRVRARLTFTPTGGTAAT